MGKGKTAAKAKKTAAKKTAVKASTKARKATTKKTAPEKKAPARAPRATKTPARKAPATAAKAIVAPAAEETGRGYSLAQAAAIVGPSDHELETMIREAHPDDRLQAEGAKVGSDRIVEDGERLSSEAVLLLQSQDAQIKEALAASGLTTSLVALLVDGLRQLDGDAHAAQRASAGGQVGRGASAAAVTVAATQGKRLRLEIRERLERAAAADPELSGQLTNDAALPDRPGALVTQLDTLARLVTGAIGHADPKVRGLARLRGLSESDATALTQAAKQLREATEARGSDGRARAAERQALLDVQDGYCLLLLGELLGAMRSAARRTRKIRRPTLVRLRGYFQGSRGHDEEEPAPTPTPA